MQRRAAASIIGFSPVGLRQVNLATAVPTANLNAVFPTTDKAFYSFDQTFEDALDCSTEEIFTRILTGQIGKISLAFDATPRLLSVISAYGLGVAAAPAGAADKTHNISELPIGFYQPPFFSLLFGFKGVSEAVILRGCVLSNFKISAKARGKVTVTADVVFVSADSISNVTYPECINELPLRFADCVLNVGAENLTTLGVLRSFDYTFDNKILTDDFAFAGDSTFASRLERDDKRTRTLQFSRLGDNKDAPYLEAEAGLTKKVISLQIGNAPSERITYNIASGLLQLDGGGLKKDGSANESLITVNATPTSAGAFITNAVAVNSQATAYLLTA